MAPLARTKTFTGCWTCRTRKIKCDLKRPKCDRCTKSNMECEGYSIKLRWSSTNDTEDENTAPRRSVEFVEFPPDMCYETYNDLDVLLAKLHSPEFELDETVVLGPFGVFEGIKGPRSRRNRKRASTAQSESDGPTTSPRKVRATSIDTPASDSQGDSLIQPLSYVSPNGAEQKFPMNPASVDDIFSGVPLERAEYEALHEELATLLHADSHTERNFRPSNSIEPAFEGMSFFDMMHPGSSADFVDDILNMDVSYSPTLTPQTQSENAGDQASDSHTPRHTPLRLFVANTNPEISQPKYVLPTQPLAQFPSRSLNPQFRYLLDYYDNNVIRIMTVVAHPKNPWRTIYLPRAYSAVGDIIAKGKTSAARLALLHAILAVSAFHIQCRMPKDSEGRQTYHDLGQRLKSEANKLLSHCLILDISRQKYKDLITAVLTMVTIDVIWGGMSDCQIHLHACQSVVSLRHRTRERTSRKAMILQRISGFLTLMQRSTVVDPDSALGFSQDGDDDRYDEQWIDLRLQDLEGTKRSSDMTADVTEASLSHMVDPNQFLEYCHQYSAENPETLSDAFYEKELVSTQSLYGIPDSLILLFNQTCRVSRRALYYRSKGDRFSRALLSSCKSLEAAFESWKERYNINKTTNFTGQIKTALNHHTLAFHQALIIYHYRLARDVKPSALRANVLAVLEHFESMQRINSDSPEPVIVPLMFPAFMAACEATEDDLIARFTAVLDRMTIEGLGTYYKAIKVAEEVWARRRSNLPDANWWAILRDWNANIMLS